MNFFHAFESMKTGKPVRRKGWKGYWFIKNDEIFIHKSDGCVMNLRDSDNIVITIENTIMEDWEEAHLEGSRDSNFSFGNALQWLKIGYKVRRKSWGNNMFIVRQKGYPNGIPCNKQTADAWGMQEGDSFVCNPYLQIQNNDGSHSMWNPSNDDIFALDWELHES